MDYGFVYCMTNESMPNICKIGCIKSTNRTSIDRAKELTNSTSSPLPFNVIFDIKVKDAFRYENIIHKKLDNYRINKKREFFKCNPQDIIEIFKMENLISSENDKQDFDKNYFTKYNEMIIMDITKYINNKDNKENKENK